MKSSTRSALFAGATALALGACASGAPHWSYHGSDGPDTWGTLHGAGGDPAFPICAEGDMQSPVDIANFGAAGGPSIDFNYQPTPLMVKNNGHTIQVDYGPGSSVSIGGDTYALLQFHFHTPSEHTILGSLHPMEGHLVHARGQGASMELAVVGFMIEEGDQNDALQAIWDVMPRTEGMVMAEGVMVDANDMLPDGDPGAAYYAYAGSLTTPPCSEGVRWQVLVEPIQASGEQIAAFQALFDLNARPVQDLNGRGISLVEN